MHSKAWLAASVWLQLTRLPPPASRMRRSHRLRDTLAAAPGLHAHTLVTEEVKFCPMGPKLRYTAPTLATGAETAATSTNKPLKITEAVTAGDRKLSPGAVRFFV